MGKQTIIEQIKRLAEDSDGTPPGMQRFESTTGIKKSTWYPHIWLKWSDALEEAGFTGNKFSQAYEKEHLILVYIDLIRELQKFPVEGELRRKRKTDSAFPSHIAFKQIGGKAERAKAVLSYCKSHQGFDDIVHYCEEITAQESVGVDTTSSEVKTGYVYLIRHGNRNEYKIGMTYNPIRREGEIRLELPEKIEPIHTIATDDPYGIEHYWHNRFKDKRKEGEWFALSSDDVRAFRKWKRIH